MDAEVRNRLKELRSARGWSQGELAGRVDVSRQTILAIEADKYDPSLPVAYRIAALLALPVEAVFENPYRSTPVERSSPSSASK